MKLISTRLIASILLAGLSAAALPATQDMKEEKKRPTTSARRPHPRREEDIKVNCSSSKKKMPISTLLANLNPDRAYTIRVKGACQDNVSVLNFTDLTLIAEPGASITDASGGISPVVSVARTTVFELQGFTINGGLAASCIDFSTCFFSGNTFQDSLDLGVIVEDSHAYFLGDTIQHSAATGLRAADGSVTIADGLSILSAGGNGAFIGPGSTLVAVNSTVRDNAAQGFRVSTHSLLSLGGSTVTNNGGNGVFVLVGSEGTFAGNTITGNGLAGVRVRDLSMVTFPDGNDVTGNLSGTDVVCEGQFGAARDTATSINGGTSNCVPE